MNDGFWPVIFLVVFSLACVFAVAHSYRENAACEARGGVMLKSRFSYTCVNVRGLR